MNKKLLTVYILSVTILTSMIMISDAFATHVHPPGIPVYNSHNEHYYEFLYIPPGTTWDSASTSAETFIHNGVRGHLATITSQTENDFISTLVPSDTKAWIGLTDKDNEGDYIWVTGEMLTYSNWHDGTIPHIYDSSKNYVEFDGHDDRWHINNNTNGITSGYVIEYDNTAVYEPVLNPANGHYYQLVIQPGILWTEAEHIAEESQFNSIDGTLVTITSQAENDFISNLLPDDFRVWIGLSDKGSEGVYRWVTGETFTYKNWDTNQPDNHNNNEDYIELLQHSGKWNDLPNDYEHGNGYIVEYHTPPNSDIDPVYNTDNGHYYVYINNGVPGQDNDPLITWDYANETAESLWWNGTRGHLVTITDEEENDFVTGLKPDDHESAMIGLSDIETEGELKWVTGEPFEYENFINVNRDHKDNVYLVYDGKWFIANGDNVSNGGFLGIIVEFSP